MKTIKIDLPAELDSIDLVPDHQDERDGKAHDGGVIRPANRGGSGHAKQRHTI